MSPSISFISQCCAARRQDMFQVSGSATKLTVWILGEVLGSQIGRCWRYIINRTNYKSKPVLFHSHHVVPGYMSCMYTFPFQPAALLLQPDSYSVTVCLLSSSVARTSVCTICLLFEVLPTSNLTFMTHPSPSLPVVVVPTRSLCLSLASALSTALSALHFRPVLTSIWAPLTFSSELSLSIITCRALVTLNSSLTDDSGN